MLHEVGGNHLKYLKRGETERKGGETKILKRGGKLGQGVRVLKIVCVCVAGGS